MGFRPLLDLPLQSGAELDYPRRQAGDDSAIHYRRPYYFCLDKKNIRPAGGGTGCFFIFFLSDNHRPQPVCHHRHCRSIRRLILDLFFLKLPRDPEPKKLLAGGGLVRHRPPHKIFDIPFGAIFFNSGDNLGLGCENKDAPCNYKGRPCNGSRFYRYRRADISDPHP